MVRAEARQPNSVEDARGSVRGTVVGAANEPLRKAEVALRGARGGPSATMVQTTDASGSFSFERLPPGNYTLTIQRNGYVTSQYRARPGVRGSGDTLTLASGQQLTGVTVRLTPQAVLAGKVFDEDGDPVLRATVQLLRERWTNGRRQLAPVSADSTNDLGEYRVHGLAPGRYFVQANLGRRGDPRLQAPSEGAETGYAPVYYPGVNDIGQATQVSLAAGQQMLGVDLQLRKVATYRIRGTVVDDAGKPATYATIMAVPSEGFAGARAMGTVRNAEGTFEIANVVPGSYTLVVNRANREERSRMTGHIPVQVGNRDLEGVVVQLTRPFEVTGSIRVPEGVAVPASARVSLEPMQRGMPFFGSNSRTQPDGTFTISGVSPGKYRFLLQSVPDGLYLKSVNVQGQDISAGAAINSAAAGVEIVLSANAPEVSGVALDSEKQPVADAYVVLVPESAKIEQHWLFRRAVTDQSGAFRVSGLVPGQYKAYAFADVEDGSWYSPDFLRTYEGKGIALKLEEGARESVQVQVAQQ